jgi:polyphenol oxidase
MAMHERGAEANDPWIAPRHPLWPAGVRALTTTRGGPDASIAGAAAGVSSGPYAHLNLAGHVGDAPDAVAANRQALAAAARLTAIQWLDQVHGTRCLEATAGTATAAPAADAAWTRSPGLAVAILSADCVPVVLTDRRGSLVGIAHAGWRGLVSGVLTSLLSALPAGPGDMLAWLGPAIGPGAYEVGEEVVEAIRALPDGGHLVKACARPAGAAGKFRVDLFVLAELLLRGAGVPLVLCDRLCTWSDQRFYSYRRDGTTGRMATLAWLDG